MHHNALVLAPVTDGDILNSAHTADVRVTPVSKRGKNEDSHLAHAFYAIIARLQSVNNYRKQRSGGVGEGQGEGEGWGGGTWSGEWERGGSGGME
jgi:hypothetical protein